MMLYIILLLLLSIVAIDSNNSNSNTITIPNIVHIIKLDRQEISNFMFTNLLSIFNKINPIELYIHYLDHPHGNNWEHIKKYPEYFNRIKLIKIKEPISLFNNIPEDRDYEHRSDCVRMNILKDIGGIYMDTDVLVLKSFEELRNSSLVLGLQYTGSKHMEPRITNAVILANKDSIFLDEWFNTYKTAKFSECWDCHSVIIPSNMLLKNITLAKDVRVLPIESFYDPSFGRPGIKELFWEPPKEYIQRVKPPYEGKYGQHLWGKISKVPLSKHTFNMMCNGTSVYNVMLRYALDGTKFFKEICG